MSLKSERKKKVKADKQAAAGAKAWEMSQPRIHKLYAEDLQEVLEDHRTECKDPNCSETAIGLKFGFQRVVAMVKPSHRKEIFLARFGTDTPADYQPFASLQLESEDGIAGVFNANGSVECMFTGPSNDQPVCFTFLCHGKGIAVVLAPDVGPGAFSLRCAECLDFFRSEGVATLFKLAPRPKAEYPNIFCNHHGIEPAFLICPHILDGAYPELLLPPDAENRGEAYCSACAVLAKQRRHDEIKIKVSCQSGLNEQLGGKLRALLEGDAA